MSTGRGRVVATIGAAIAGGLLAAAVLSVTDPYESVSTEDYQEVVRVGLVLRYALLAGAGAWLLLQLAAARRAGRQRTAVFSAVALVVVVALAAVPPFVEDRASRPELAPPPASRDFRAEFIAGCARRNPEAYCLCLYETVTARGGDEALGELAARAEESGRAPRALVRAVDECVAAAGDRVGR